MCHTFGREESRTTRLSPAQRNFHSRGEDSETVGLVRGLGENAVLGRGEWKAGPMVVLVSPLLKCYRIDFPASKNKMENLRDLKAKCGGMCLHPSVPALGRQRQSDCHVGG